MIERIKDFPNHPKPLCTLRTTHDLSNCQLIKYRSAREQNQYCQLVYESVQKYERPIKNKSKGWQRWAG